LLTGIKEDYISLSHVPGFYPIEHFKPMVRPLFKLTEEIEINGEKFVPSDRTQIGMQYGRIYSNIGIL